MGVIQIPLQWSVLSLWLLCATPYSAVLLVSVLCW